MDDENKYDDKKDDKDINYGEKIETFKLMIENNNDDIALMYLQKADWDEERAVMLYHSEDLNPQNYNTSISNSYNFNYNISKSNPPKVKKSSFDFSKYEQCPIKYPQKPGFLSGILNFFGPKNYSNEYGITNFNRIKGYASNYELFIQNLKNKLGILFIYDDKTIFSMKNIINGIINDLSLSNLFNNKTVFPLYNLSETGKYILSNIHITKLPIMLVCKYKNKSSFVVIKKTKPGNLSLDSVKEVIKSAEELVNSRNQNKTNTPNNNNIDSQCLNNDFNYDDFCFLSNGEVIEQQKKDLEELEKKERDKNEKERKLKEEKKREEERILNNKI